MITFQVLRREERGEDIMEAEEPTEPSIEERRPREETEESEEVIRI